VVEAEAFNSRFKLKLQNAMPPIEQPFTKFISPLLRRLKKRKKKKKELPWLIKLIGKMQ
jgi:hypothetical protein